MAKIDLSALAISIVILGIVTAIGSTVLVGIRDATTLEGYTINDTITSINSSGTPDTIGLPGCTGISACYNSTTGFLINAGNYSVGLPGTTYGRCTVEYVGYNTETSGLNATEWVCTTDGGNINQTDYALASDAAIGIGEYGNWFEILVIVGIAAVILGLIFYAFRNKMGSNTQGY